MIYKRDPRFRRYGPAAAQNISYMPDSSFDVKAQGGKDCQRLF